MHHTKKIPRIKTFFFDILHLSSKFQSFRFNNKIKISKTESVPSINNTNELIRKMLSEQLHNQIIYARLKSIYILRRLKTWLQSIMKYKFDTIFKTWLQSTI